MGARFSIASNIASTVYNIIVYMPVCTLWYSSSSAETSNRNGARGDYHGDVLFRLNHLYSTFSFQPHKVGTRQTQTDQITESEQAKAQRRLFLPQVRDTRPKTIC